MSEEMALPVVTVISPQRLQRHRISVSHRKHRIYLDLNSPPPSGPIAVSSAQSRTAWRRRPAPITTSSISSPIVQLSHLQPNRRELWQESTPSEPAFPLIRPPHKRRFRPRSVVRAKGAKLRKDWSKTIVSAYDAARAPFRLHQTLPSSQSASKSERPPLLQEAAASQPPRPSLPLRTVTNDSTSTSRTIRITGPLTSPARSDFLVFTKRPARPIFISPLSSNPPPVVRYGRDINMARAAQPQTSDSLAATRQALAARKRDSFNRAKIHVRRPPKGITHWFDALDDDSSEDDFPEAVVPASAPPNMTAFQPSLGPRRSRAAPTSFVSQASDASADYFGYSYYEQSMRRQKSTKGAARTASRLGMSVLDLSSDDEADAKAPSIDWDRTSPSPSPYHSARRPGAQRGGSATPLSPPGFRQSMASMQTTLTSATIPFMLHISPMGDSRAPPVPFLARHPASYLALTGRPITADSRAPQSENGRRSQMSTTSARTSNRSEVNYVAVTSEEMAVLEMLRRKRAAAKLGYPIDSPAITEVEEPPVPMPSPLNLQRPSKPATVDQPERNASVATTVTVELDSGENISFPTPPTPGKSPLPRPPSRGKQQPHLPTVEALINNMPTPPRLLDRVPTPPPAASYWTRPPVPPKNEIAELDGSPYVPPSDPPRNRSASSMGSRRTSNFSLLHPHVFGSPVPIGTSPFDSTPHPKPADPIRSDSNSSWIDFSALSFSPVPNLLSPSLGGLLTSATTPGHDWPRHRSPSPSTSAPSLTDAASLSGSRSEVDTPTKEAQGIFGAKVTVLHTGEVLCEEREAEEEVRDAWRGLGGYRI